MKVLVSEDDVVSQILLKRLLVEWGYEPVIVGNGQQALDLLLQDNAPELVLLDWETPGLDGYEVCRELRTAKPEDFPHVIFVTARDSSDAMVEGLEVGASDFISKPFKAKELQARVQAGRRIIEMRRQLREAERRMAEHAYLDALTGVLNRRAMADLLEKELQRSRRSGLPLSVALVDLDQFKRINDTAGHQVGDQALIGFTRVAKEIMRATDSLGRWGGDEFMIVAPSAPGEAAPPGLWPLFERLRQKVEATPAPSDRLEFQPTVSIGATLTNGLETVEHLVERMDQALYQAKAAGRNQVAFLPAPASASPDTTTGDRLNSLHAQP